jgi:hypothetical protein
MRPKDRLAKIHRMEKLIGPAVRKVHKMYYYVFFSLLISILTLCKEKWDNYQLKKNQKKNNTINNQ